MRATLKRADWLPLLCALALSAVVSVLVFLYRDALGRLGDWGYAGVFLVQLVNSLTILLPAVGHVVVLALATTLNPWLLGLVGGIGAGLGELSGYVVGMTGRRMLALDTPLLARLVKFAARWGGAAIFLFAATPLPFDVVGIWAGSVRYPLARFLLYTITGKIVKVSSLALAGHYGIRWLERLFG